MKQRQIWIAMVLLFVAAILVSSTPQAAKKTVLYPYKMVVENAAGTFFDSTITITDNVDYQTGHLSKQQQGRYAHTYRVGHRDSVQDLVFDTVDFYFNILDYDAGMIGYGITGYAHPEQHDDSGSIQWAVTVELGTELSSGGNFQKLRGLTLQEHGIGTDEVDTIAYDKLINDSIFFINIAEELPGTTDADSSWMLCSDKIRLRLVYKDSSQSSADTLFDDGWTFLYRAFMLVREEY